MHTHTQFSPVAGMRTLRAARHVTCGEKPTSVVSLGASATVIHKCLDLLSMWASFHKPLPAAGAYETQAAKRKTVFN